MAAPEVFGLTPITTADQPRILPCIVCTRSLDPAMRGEREPYPATVFISHGNCGSTLFDDDGRFLRVHICDECLEEAAVGHRVECGVPTRPVSTTVYSEWTADAERALFEAGRGPETREV